MAHSESFSCPAPLPLDSAHHSILNLVITPLGQLAGKGPLVELDVSCVSQMTVEHVLKSSHALRHVASKALFPMFVIP